MLVRQGRDSLLGRYKVIIHIALNNMNYSVCKCRVGVGVGWSRGRGVREGVDVGVVLGVG